MGSSGGLLLLTATIVAYNNLINLWPPFHRGVEVPLNLLATAILLVLAFGPLRLDANALGLRGPHRRGLALGALVAVALVAPLFVALAHPSTAELVADERVAELSGAALVYRVTVRIVLATALLEEVAFRGVLLAAWERTRPRSAVLVTSVAFGLWHITPATDLLEANRSGAGPLAYAGVVLVAIVLTAVAGALLIWCRKRIGTLAAPFAFHALLNSLATIAAWLAHART